MADLKDWLNSINLNKQDITLEDPQLIKKYSPFIINKCMSAHLDCIMFANEMNLNAHLANKDLQYQFYLNSIRKKKRFSREVPEKIRSRTLMLSNHTMVIVMRKQSKH